MQGSLREALERLVARAPAQGIDVDQIVGPELLKELRDDDRPRGAENAKKPAQVQGKKADKDRN
jgi:hypothetical protein